MTRKKWQLTAYDKDLASQIAQDYSLNPFTALLATSRGLLKEKELLSFFNDSFGGLSDPYGLPDMDKAVSRIETAIENNESILIFGDYDADGVTATALLYSYLDARGANVSSYIPDRITEGYGLSPEAVKAIREKEAKLIITVDNGISALDEANQISALGMELIITDHHKPKDVLPSAVAVIDPHRADCTCDFKDFAGVGVAFKLICALDGGDSEDLLHEFGELLSIGTVGDIVPLSGENRLFVKAGIDAINNCPSLGIRALLDAAGAGNKRITSSGIAFVLSPRINAAGRMGCAGRAMALLLTDDENNAKKLAEEINDENILRKKIEDEITEKAEEIFRVNPRRIYDQIIVIDGDGWHNGVIGIVASRIAEKYGRPCIIISRDGDSARGSGRSIEGFSLYAALYAVSDCLTHFGGHTLAAGFGIMCDRIDIFREAINKYAGSADMPFPLQQIDFKLNPKAVNAELVEALEVFEPYGAGNPQPVFGLFGMMIESITAVSDGKHTRISVSKENTKLNVIIFNSPTLKFPYENGDYVDLAVQLENNEYRGILNVNIRAVNIRFAKLNEEGVLSGLRLYEKHIRSEVLPLLSYPDIFPDRDLLANLYRIIKENGCTVPDMEKLCCLIGDDGKKITAVMVALDVMQELSLITKDKNGYLSINSINGKVKLEESAILKKLKSSFI